MIWNIVSRRVIRTGKGYFFFQRFNWKICSHSSWLTRKVEGTCFLKKKPKKNKPWYPHHIDHGLCGTESEILFQERFMNFLPDKIKTSMFPFVCLANILNSFLKELIFRWITTNCLKTYTRDIENIALH